MHKIKQYLQIEHLDIQLHTQDAHAWVRSWDFESYGEDLKPFRKGLETLRQTKLPLVSIELGKRLNIKALCPIFDKETYIGSLEVIMGFDEISAKLKDKKIHFLVLMDKEFLEIGEWMKELEQMNDFVIVSNSCGKACHGILKPLISSEILENGFARMEGMLFGFTPLFDIEANVSVILGFGLMPICSKNPFCFVPRFYLAPKPYKVCPTRLNFLKTLHM